MIEVNWMAIIVAAIVAQIIGFAWFSDTLFGKQWRKLMGVNTGKPSQSQMTKMMLLGVVSSLIMAYVLNHSVIFAKSFLGTTGMALGFMTGFWNWIGYMLPVLISGYLYEKKPVSLVALTSAYWLVSLLVMGVIIAYWS